MIKQVDRSGRHEVINLSDSIYLKVNFSWPWGTYVVRDVRTYTEMVPVFLAYIYMFMHAVRHAINYILLYMDMYNMYMYIYGFSGRIIFEFAYIYILFYILSIIVLVASIPLI